MKKQLSFLIFISILAACNNSKNDTKQESFISVRSLIEGQVAHVDTSLYSIMRIEYTDSSAHDTTYIRREDFRETAAVFLSIPDLADPKVAKKYMAEPAQYDETLEKVIITYKPIDPEKEEVKKQELLVTPAPATGDKVNNILVLREISNRDSFMKQDMLWLMDRSFQVTTTKQKKGTPETITVTRVIWNRDPNE